MRVLLGPGLADADRFRIPMRGYELAYPPPGGGATRFRIPMRGYEPTPWTPVTERLPVPNPHEGL